jgi:hypothetical protein
VKQVTLTDVRISADKGMTVTDATGVVFKNVQINATTGPPITTNHADVSEEH